MVIPDYGPADLSLSSVTLATSMEPIDYQTSAGKPFHLGKFKVVPNPGSAFKKSDELNIYFQVYNPAPDPESGALKLEVEYDFRAKTADGTLKDMGTYAVKDATGQVQGYAVPLQKWPAGNYDVLVTVKDLVSGKTRQGEASFSIGE